MLCILRSVERCLERVLYLLVKKPREEHAWQMPQGGLEEGESLLKVEVPPLRCRSSVTHTTELSDY